MQKAEIIFENDYFIALNKPSGVLSIPDREGKEASLKSWLREQYGNIFTVHRLDRETSGIILFAKDEETHKYLSRMFEERTVEKIYAGIVSGTLIEKKGSIDIPVIEHPVKKGMMTVNKKGKASLTDYEVIEEWGLYSLVKWKLHTGRTHQIRVHMQWLGHPILCDELYGDANPVYISSLKKNYKLSKTEEQERPILQRLALHSQFLGFEDGQGMGHDLEAPLPKDMRALVQQLRKWKANQ